MTHFYSGESGGLFRNGQDLNDAFNYGVVLLKPDEKLHAGVPLRQEIESISVAPGLTRCETYHWHPLAEH